MNILRFEVPPPIMTDHAARPNRMRRIAIALCVACAAAGLTLYLRVSGTSPFSDFDVMWLASRGLIAGQNPYAAVTGRFQWPLHYPLPAVLVTTPFAVLPEIAAAAAWIGLGYGLLAYALTECEWWPLLCLANYPAVDAAQMAQWSPLLTAIAFMPLLGFLAITKPTTGGAIAAAYVNRTGKLRNFVPIVTVAVTLIVTSFLLRPDWVQEWAGSIRTANHFKPLVLRPGGFLLLAALARWRRPEARLLALLAVTPQSTAAYDALPLILVISSKREAFLFAWLSFAAVPFLTTAVGTGRGFTAAIDHNAPILLVTTYAPALVMILRRPNEGPAPRWVDRMLMSTPEWLRGNPTPREGAAGTTCTSV